MSLEALSPDGLVAMFWQMRTHFHAVSFERTPPVEIGARAAALEARSWIWLENRPNWIARVAKDFSDDTSSLQAENDIRKLWGSTTCPSASSLRPDRRTRASIRRIHRASDTLPRALP
jgi:hypothetical protein